ncbi:MAG: hypothetical protein SFU85_13395 [Candidatus Methylacidiphilales bacterium]|nr:hypothetical protein [Candidatus Methylacidiphilales bacterium]
MTSLFALAGGLLYHPNNYDFLTYRFPRILHWWWEGGWHWIVTGNDRLNYSGTGFEWMVMPLFQFTRSDRLFFLLNWIPYLLMPGLVYSVFKRLGLGRKTAWVWMWLLPSGYCYAMQAGSAGNDSYAVVYVLAALHFGFMARDLWSAGPGPGVFLPAALSVLSAALLTGAKASNLPLLLPCLLPLLPLWKEPFRQPLRWVSLGVVAAGVSFLPLAVLNHLHVGDWSGDPDNNGKMKLDNPAAGVAGNVLQLAVGSLQPPLLPLPAWWNGPVNRLADSLGVGQLKTDFPRLSLNMGELPNEEGAGLGLGLTLFLGLSGATAMATRLRLWRRFGKAEQPGTSKGLLDWLVIGVCLTGFLAAAVYAAKMGSECTARLLAPYYPLLIAAVLRLSGPVPDCRWISWCGVGVAATAWIPLALTPSRPLVPVEVIVRECLGNRAEGKTWERVKQVYEVYSRRWDALAPVREALPSGVRVVGFAGSGDDSEVSLWRPFGRRQVRFHSDGMDGLDWVVLKRKPDASEASPPVGSGRYRLRSSVPVVSKIREGSCWWDIWERLP